MKVFILISAVLTHFVLHSCGREAAYEKSKSLTASDLKLTTENHPHGYMQSECFACHVKSNIHRQDRLGIPSLVETARDLADRYGTEKCYICHGRNGVTQ